MSASGKYNVDLGELKSNFAKELERYPILDDLSSKTGLSHVNLVVLLGPILAWGHYFGLGATFYVGLAGYLYPAIASLYAVRSSDKTDDTQWLTYWTVFSALHMCELFALGFVLRLFPFYYAFKFGFLLWCQSPSSKGALFVYSHLLSPFVKSHELRDS